MPHLRNADSCRHCMILATSASLLKDLIGSVCPEGMSLVSIRSAVGAAGGTGSTQIDVDVCRCCWRQICRSVEGGLLAAHAQELDLDCRH